MGFSFAHLTSRAVLAVHGTEAAPFLQGLLTQEVEGLIPGDARYAALLSPQGKMLFDCLLVRTEGGYLLDIEAARADALSSKLKLYRLRAKVTLAPRDDLAVFAVFDGSPPELRETQAFADPRSPLIGLRIIGDRAMVAGELAALGTAVEEAAFRHLRHRMGIAEGSAELGVERAFALEANLEDLSGVDFKKGCYVGQELTARMKHKTELKKRVLPVTCAKPPMAGEPVMAGTTEIGHILGGADREAYALVRLDRLSEALTAGSDLLVSGAPARFHAPPYLKTPIEGLLPA